MKSFFKKFLFAFACIIPFIFGTGCASGTKKTNETVLTVDSKLISITQALANQLVNENTEAAYNRMAEEYRVFVSLEAFEKEWNSKIAGEGKCTGTEEPYCSNISKSYQTVTVPYNLENGRLYASYIYSVTNVLPIGVTYSQEKPVVSQSENAELPPLRELCKNYYKLGFGINGYTTANSAMNYPEFMELGAKQFSSCTMTNLMKPSSILDQAKSAANSKKGDESPAINFKVCDSYLQWCKDNNIQMRGHTLVWHTQTPEWFFRKNYDPKADLVDRDTMITRLDSFIGQYMTHVQEKFPGVVYCWDVVNECVDPGNGDPNSPFHCRMYNDKNPNQWYFTIGADYPEVAFTIARKYAAPGVSLIYNDYGTTDRTKREFIYTLCSDLAQKGLIDGIGMQAYWDNRNPTLKNLADTINLYAKTGLEIQLTEWSISAENENDDGLAAQAERYASIFRLLQKLDTQGGGNANITCVSFFGLMDHYPLYQKDTTSSRLFDGKLNPKPVFYSVQDTLNEFYK